MTLAELFVAIGIKIENLDQLAALETMLRNVTAQARAALQAVNALNAAQSGNAAPSTPPPVPGLTPTAPNPLGPTVTPTNPPPALPTPQKVVPWITSVKKLSTELNKLALAVTAVAVGMVVLIAKSIKATMELANFGESTGLATDKIQQFQHAAAVAGSSGKELLLLVDSLQAKQAAIALGEGDLSPFAFFGIDPTQDPTKVLEQLRVKIRGLSAEQLLVARNMAERLGVGRDMFAAFRREAEGISTAFTLSPESIESTRKLNAAWQDLVFRLEAVRNAFVSSLAPTLRVVIGLLAALLKPISVFVKWLNSGTVAANAMRMVLGVLAVVVGFLAGVIVVVAAAVGALAVALGLASAASAVLGATLWASGIAEVILLITAVVAAFIAVGVALVLVVDDIITTFEGGESACRNIGEAIGELISGPILALMDAFGAVRDFVGNVWDTIVGKIKGAVAAVGSIMPDWLKNLFGGDGKGVAVNPMQSITNAAAMPPSNQRGGGGTANQTNEIQINVDGSRDPRATASSVRDELAKSYAEAAYQMPVTSY